jgi:predicted DNA-binding transcriptional regulator
MNETAKKYLELMKKNGKEHLEGIDGFIEQTTKQLEEAKEKREEIASDLEELEKAFEAESDEE